MIKCDSLLIIWNQLQKNILNYVEDKIKLRQNHLVMKLMDYLNEDSSEDRKFVTF